MTLWSYSPLDVTLSVYGITIDCFVNDESSHGEGDQDDDESQERDECDH